PYAAPTGTGSGSSSGVSLGGEPKQLPPGGTFSAAQVALDNRGAAVFPAIGASEQAVPILFYPDGTTSDALLQLQNEEGERITLSLRGLTGIVQVGPLEYSADTLPAAAPGAGP